MARRFGGFSVRRIENGMRLDRQQCRLSTSAPPPGGWVDTCPVPFQVNHERIAASPVMPTEGTAMVKADVEVLVRQVPQPWRGYQQSTTNCTFVLDTVRNVERSRL